MLRYFSRDVIDTLRMGLRFFCYLMRDFLRDTYDEDRFKIVVGMWIDMGIA
jgi:hypothetical protein